ncbi:hypothetical protein A2U01_0098921, partial [Trifolium medium]|nr:hypothetical protein [Trifolium medium]
MGTFGRFDLKLSISNLRSKKIHQHNNALLF